MAAGKIPLGCFSDEALEFKEMFSSGIFSYTEE